jgi:hypothetical protein
MRWLRHAFAIERAEAFGPTVAEQALVERLTAELSRRRLTMPAMVLLESLRPLGSITAQAIWFSYPWFAALFDARGLKVLGQLLERPGGVEWMLARIGGDPEPANKSSQTASEPRPAAPV